LIKIRRSAFLSQEKPRGAGLVLPHKIKHMKTMERTARPAVLKDEAEFDRRFRPTGAVLFFILLVLLGMAIWFGIYYLMLQRA
jgi:hypothetical protein